MVRSVTLRLMVLLVGAVAAQSQTTPVVSPGGVVDAAAFTSPVAPGALVSIFGSNLASAQAVADTIPLSTSIGNVSVTFNGIPSPLLFVSTGLVNAQLPWEVLSSGTVGTADVVVTSNGQVSTSVSVPVGPFSPGIFTIDGKQAVAYSNSDNLFAAPPGAIPGLTTHPAKINDPLTLVILATGLGPVDPPVQTGTIPPADGTLHKTTTNPTVTVGGVAAQVFFSGIAPFAVGVYQLNVILDPRTPTGNAVPLQISIGGATSTITTTIAVSN
jgi:uncharacterized protein (TIGR03437 family)